MFIRTIALVTVAALTASAQEVSRLDTLVGVLGKMEKPEVQANILNGMKDSLQGQRGVAAPKGWEEIAAKLKDSPDETVRARIQELSVIFGGGAAMGEMRAKLADVNAPVEARRQALDSLVAQRDAASLDSLLKLAGESGPLREPTLRGLAGFDDGRIAPLLTELYGKLDTTERRAALQTLLARASGAKAFLAAVDSGAIAKGELTAPIARQLDGLKDADVSAWLAKKWGAVSAPNEDKKKLIAKFKEFTSAEAIARADANKGRAIFGQTCVVCHTMFGTGGHIGPELTGGYGDVDYLLNNILDPNAIIGKDYQQTFVKTKDGQTVAGIVTLESDTAITLKNLAGESVTVQKSDVASTEVSPLSMMPEGLLMAMDEESVRDLFHYLGHKSQIRMLVTAGNANDFFTGSDLKNWHADAAWTVAAGELVGKGGAKPAALVSEMVLGEGKLTVSVKMTGSGAAELALNGAKIGDFFRGDTLSFGGASAMNVWTYADGKPATTALTKALGDGWHKLELERSRERTVLKLDGAEIWKKEGATPKLAPSFVVMGEGTELRLKDLRVEGR